MNKEQLLKLTSEDKELQNKICELWEKFQWDKNKELNEIELKMLIFSL